MIQCHSTYHEPATQVIGLHTTRLPPTNMFALHYPILHYIICTYIALYCGTLPYLTTLHLHLHLHACMHTYMHACMHTYIQTNIHSFIPTYIPVNAEVAGLPAFTKVFEAPKWVSLHEPWKINGWNTISWGFGSDDFSDFNWVIFRFRGVGNM